MSLFSTSLPCFVCAGLHVRCSGAAREQPSHLDRYRALPGTCEESLARRSVLCSSADLQDVCTAQPPRQGLLSRFAGLCVAELSSLIPCPTIQKLRVGNKNSHALPWGKGNQAQQSQGTGCTDAKWWEVPITSKSITAWHVGETSSTDRWRASRNALSSLDLPSLVINAGK